MLTYFSAGQSEISEFKSARPAISAEYLQIVRFLGCLELELESKTSTTKVIGVLGNLNLQLKYQEIKNLKKTIPIGYRNKFLAKHLKFLINKNSIFAENSKK